MNDGDGVWEHVLGCFLSFFINKAMYLIFFVAWSCSLGFQTIRKFKKFEDVNKRKNAVFKNKPFLL